jgi:ParB family chromosome partitioning protein
MKKAAEKTAGIDMSGFQSRVKVIDGQSPNAADPSKEAPVRKFTGVGNVMAAITREAEVSHELVGVRANLEEATRKLAEFDGALLVRALDPASIRRSRWANRNEAEFVTPEFRQLKDEIASAGSNVQPIKVRVIDGQSHPFEIVFGHRRYQACVELGLPVQAVVVERMTDQELFEAMDRENRVRKNLSAWEQGRMYDDAVKNGLYPSIRRLAESLGVNQSDASRAIQLAKLPNEVVSAFASPLDLQVRWAKPLGDALQRDPDGVLARARSLKKERGGLGAAEIFDRLVGRAASPAAAELVVSVAGKKVATLKSGSKGRVIVEFEAGALTQAKHGALVKALEDFLAQ